jgi:hypothetical protein
VVKQLAGGYIKLLNFIEQRFPLVGKMKLLADSRGRPSRTFLRLHPRQFQPALHFALMAQIEGFTLELTMPLSDRRIASGA